MSPDPVPPQKEEVRLLDIVQPFIWPETRVRAGIARYRNQPPVNDILAKADVISGLLVGTADGTVDWIRGCLDGENKRKLTLVLVLYPAGPTRELHLRALLDLQFRWRAAGAMLDVRLFPVERLYGEDFERPSLPPTVIQAHNSSDGSTTLCIGSIGDACNDKMLPGSLNFVLTPGDALNNEWRQSFQYLLSSAAPLTEATARIPHLVPAQGDPEALRRWEEFQRICNGSDPAQPPHEVAVNPETGEVTHDVNGDPVEPWDEGKTALDPLSKVFQQVYANGYLVTIDEATRIKPLTIPVKAALLGQQAQRTVGALKQKQMFSLKVLDESVDRAIEKCRSVSDVMEVLAVTLSQGNRWISEAAKMLLEQELNARNSRGQEELKKALGGKSVREFVTGRIDGIRKDLNEMYALLGMGKTVPEDKLRDVIAVVEERLTKALDARITPRAVYNRISPPDLTNAAPDDNWSQPLMMLVRSARMLRDSFSDNYFPRRFTGMSFTIEEYRQACDVFEDDILRDPDIQRARHELDEMTKITESDDSPKAKCYSAMDLIKKRQA